MNNQEIENSEIDWADVIVKLQAFTRSIVTGRGWFRGNNTKNFIAGKEIDDYVYGAIERYLVCPDSFDSSKGSLINYLKYNLIRMMVSNDLTSAENITTKNIYAFATKQEEEGDDSDLYLDSIFPYAETFFDLEIDYKVIMESIEQEVQNDAIMESIFLGLNYYDMKRRQIIVEFGISETDFDNGMRRLRTILKNTAKKFELI
jgi:hypothetical protein